MTTSVAFWVGFLVGRFIAAMMILSLVLAFVRNQTRKNIVITGIAAFLIAVFISCIGDINGRLLTWSLAKYLLLVESIPLFVVFVIAVLLTVVFHWNTQKWFAKVLPWAAGIIYGSMLCMALPQVIKEQIEIQKVADEMTFKQFNALPNDIKAETAYKIAGVKDGNIFDCIRASQDSTNIQDVKFKEIVDTCRDIIYGNPPQE